MSIVREEALGFVPGVCCPECDGRGVVKIKGEYNARSEARRYVVIAAAFCPHCKGGGSVPGRASEALAGEGPGGLSGLEPGADAGAAKKAPLSSAQRAKAYRERKKASDPGWLAREAKRKRDRRRKTHAP